MLDQLIRKFEAEIKKDGFNPIYTGNEISLHWMYEPYFKSLNPESGEYQVRARLLRVLSRLTTEAGLSPLDDEFIKALCSWVGGSYEPKDVKTLLRLQDDTYKQFSGTLYRGEPFRKEDAKALKENRLEADGVSWTTDKAVALDHASQHDSPQGMIITYKPKPQEIGLNISLLLENEDVLRKVEERQCKVYSESEIILTDNVPVTKDMIEVIEVA